MIVRPTSKQLLEAVRKELRNTVTPAVSNPEVQAKLSMIDSILGSVAARSDHEVAWIREEIAEIERGAQAVITAQADRGGLVKAALKALESGRSQSDRLSDLHAEYILAGEVLSCALEAALQVGGVLCKTVENILAARLAREAEIRGEFALAGRE